MKYKLLPGINIQWPISELIMSGKKTIETRTYPIPQKFIGQELAVIETPGKKAKFKARIIGTVRFGKSFQYKNKNEFYADAQKHCVTPDSEWKWTSGKEKWGWTIVEAHRFLQPFPPPQKRGIIFATDCHVPV